MNLGRIDKNTIKEEWLTPPWLLVALDAPRFFDLDPCAPIERPWSTAARHFTIADNGLNQEWKGHVWLNPPYGKKTNQWLERMAIHGDGIALILARTETVAFRDFVWGIADSVLFIHQRIKFYHSNGTEAKQNNGFPSVLVAYGSACSCRLEMAKIKGTFIPDWNCR